MPTATHCTRGDACGCMHETHRRDGVHAPRLGGGLLLLLGCVLLCGVATARGDKTEVNRTEMNLEYRCRACMALSSVFQAEVQNAMKVQREMFRDGARRGSKTAEAGMRQRLVVDIHEAIDNLCHRVKVLHRTENNLQAARADADADADRLWMNADGVSGSRRTMRDAVDGLCVSVLEEVNDPLAQKAFTMLQPNRVQPAAETTEAGANYRLNDAGAFCEEQQMCTPHLVHRMLQDEVEARRVQQWRTEQQQQQQANEEGKGTATAVAFSWISSWWHFFAASVGGALHLSLTLAVGVAGVAAFLLFARCKGSGVSAAAAAAATATSTSVKHSRND